MCTYMYTCIYVCATESSCSMSAHYLIMKPKPSFVLILVFTADYQADGKGTESNHPITLGGSSCKS